MEHYFSNEFWGHVFGTFFGQHFAIGFTEVLSIRCIRNWKPGPF